MIMREYLSSVKSLEKYQPFPSQSLKEESVGDYVEPRVHPLYLLQLLNSNPYHAAACTIKTNDIVKTGYTLTNDDGRVEGFLKACKPSFEYVLLSSIEDLQVFNYCSLEIVRDDDGEPVRFEYVPAHTVRVHRDGTRYKQTWDGVHVTYFKDYRHEGEVNPETGEDLEGGGVGANELLFIHLPSPICSYYGVPKYLSAVNSILTMKKIDEYNYAFFDNFTLPSYVITVTGDFEDEEILDSEGNPTGRTVLQKAIEENFTYLKENPHSPIVLSIPGNDTVKVEFTPLNKSMDDADFKQYYHDKKFDVAAAHMIDPYRLGIGDIGALGGNLAESTRKTYYESVVRPQQKIIASILTDFFQIKFSSDVIFEFNDETLLESSIVNNYCSLIHYGVLSPEEVYNKLSPNGGSVSGKRLRSLKSQEPPGTDKIRQRLEKLFKTKYSGKIEDVLRSQQPSDAKGAAVTTILEEFKDDARAYAYRLIPAQVPSGVAHGQITLPSGSLEGKYKRLIDLTLDDMTERMKSYLLKVIEWEGL